MKKYSILTICLLLNASCAKDFLDKQPLSELNSEGFYKTEEDAKKAILACYSTLQVPFFYGRSVPYIAELGSDDANHKNTNNPLDVFQWTPIAINESEKFSDMWKQCYEGVYRCNIIIGKLNGIPFAKAENKSIINAEAHFLRALYFWHLTAYWGDVPIITDVKENVEQLNIPNSTEKEVYAQIIKDLLIAEADLPFSPITTPEATGTKWSVDNGGRATKFAAKALLGKVYIFDQQWGLAIPKLEEVVNNGGYKLLDSFREVFSRTNELNVESIFEIQFGEVGPWQPWNPFISDIGNGGEGNFRDLIMAPQGVGNQKGFGEIIAEGELVQEYELYDTRLRETVHYPYDFNGKFASDSLYGYNTDNNRELDIYREDWALLAKAGGNKKGEYYHIKKSVSTYQGIGTTGNATTNWRMIRLADVMLLLAEAYNENGDVENARKLLNKVRERARGMEFKNNPNKVNPKKFLASVGDSVEVLPAFVSGQGYFTYSAFGKELDFSAGDKDAMRRALIHERRMELAFEYHRLLDMTRWERIDPNHPGAANVVFSTKEARVSNRNYVLGKHGRCPIPQFQIDLSKGTLKQNPGY